MEDAYNAGIQDSSWFLDLHGRHPEAVIGYLCDEAVARAALLNSC
jgi:hypothetical protein